MAVFWHRKDSKKAGLKVFQLACFKGIPSLAQGKNGTNRSRKHGRPSFFPT
jgi:hypothetical protein